MPHRAEKPNSDTFRRQFEQMRRLFVVAAKSAVALLGLVTVGLMAFASYLAWHYAYGIGLPDRNRLAAVSATRPVCSTDPQRTYVALADIPPLLRKAVILSENPDYYERPSLNLFAELGLAIAHDREPRPSNIAGSVTRCLMSLAEGCCHGQSLDRAIGEIVLQNRVVRALSRDRILEIFLNESYFGRGSYGVGSAAMSYFGRPLDTLTIDEIALVAALPRAPSFWHGRGRDVMVERRNTLIDKMLRAGIINNVEAASARERPLEFRERPPQSRSL